MSAFDRILLRYGDLVECHVSGEAPKVGRALIQPILDTSAEQWEPTPQGVTCQDQFLYLGETGLSLETAANGEISIRWKDTDYRVTVAHPIELAGKCSHWWAVLRPLEVTE